MLILEGSDYLGKTTAANRLVELASERAARGVKLLETGDDLTIRDAIFPVRYCHMTRPNLAFDHFTDFQDLISVHAVQDRFHLGSLAYHENAITAETLSFIEAWLGNVGSYTVVFISTNKEWYEKRLQTSSRKEMFSIEQLCKVNDIYFDMVAGNYLFPVKIDRTICIDENSWPTDELLNDILDCWYRRLKCMK